MAQQSLWDQPHAWALQPCSKRGQCGTTLPTVSARQLKGVFATNHKNTLHNRVNDSHICSRGMLQSLSDLHVGVTKARDFKTGHSTLLALCLFQWKSVSVKVQDPLLLISCQCCLCLHHCNIHTFALQNFLQIQQLLNTKAI